MLDVKELPDRRNLYGAFAQDGSLLFCLEKRGAECEVRESSESRHYRGRLLVTFIGSNCLEEATHWANSTGISLLGLAARQPEPEQLVQRR